MRAFLSTILSVLLVLGMAADAALAQRTNPRTQTQSAPQKPPEAPATETPSATTPSVTGAAAPVDPKMYKIGAGDVLGVRVWGENELSGPVQVRPDGMVTLPLIGDMKAADLTPDQLTAEVTQALTKYINKPQVIVSVNAVLSKKYYIRRYR